MRRVAVAFLLVLPLLAGLPSGAQAQVTPSPTATLVPHALSRTLPEGAGTRFNINLSRHLSASETVTLPLTVGGTAGRSDYRLVCDVGIPAVTCNGFGGASPSLTFHGARMPCNESRNTCRRITAPFRIQMIEDNTAESDETVTLRLGGGSQLSLTVRDAPSSVTVSFLLERYTTTEGLGVIQPSLRVDPLPGRDIEVPLVFTDITATKGEDYTAVATVTFEANGNSANTFDLPLLDDTLCEGAETFRVAIDASRLPAGVRVGARRSAVVEITDYRPCTVSLDSDAYSVTEGGSLSVTLNMDPPRDVPVEVGIVYSDADDGGGTARRRHPSFDSQKRIAFGKDYEASPESVTVPANAASHTFTIRTLPDNPAVPGAAPESDETFQIAIDADALPRGTFAGSPSGATVTIKEGGGPSVTIAAGAARLDEGGVATFTVTADPPPAKPLEVNVEVVEDGWDRYSVAGGGLGRRKVAIGADGMGSFSVATVDDGTQEVHGRLTARVLIGPGYTAGTESQATVNVSDNDQKGGLVPYTLRRETRTLPEGAGVDFNHLLLSNDRGPRDQGSATPQPGQTLTLPLEVGGTATPGIDYRLVCIEVDPPGIATCNRDGNGNIVSFTLDGALFKRTQYRTTGPLRLEAIADDDATEPDETVVLTLGGGPPLTLTLVEAPASVSLSFTRDNYSWIESAGGLDVIIDVSPPTGSPIPLPLVFTDLTATAGVDYTIPRDVVIPADGASTVNVFIPFVDDDVAEGHEAFRVEIDAARLPAGVTLGAIPSTLFFIRDDNEPGLMLSRRALAVDEGGSAEYAVKPATRPSGTELTVRVASDNPDVTVSPSQLTFSIQSSAGNSWLHTQTVTVTAAQDSGDGDADDSAVLTHTASGGDYEGLTATLDVTVDDDDAAPDPPGVTVSQTTLSLTEGGAAGSYTVALDAAPTANVTVTATSGNAAKARVGRSGDTPAASATLTFTPANWNQAQTILVTPVDDADTNDETVTVSHGVSATGGYGGVTAAPVSVAVDDDDTTVMPPPPPPGCVPAQVEADVRGYAAETHQGQAHVDRWLKVLAAFGDGNGHAAMTAAEARGYANRGWTRWNPVVQALECVEGISSDPLVSVTGGAAVTEGGNAVFTVTADPAPASSLTVTLGVADAPGGDFLAPGDEGPANVTIPANQASAQLTIATRDDNVYEPDGAVTATVAEGAGYRVGSPSSASVAVGDDDPVPAGRPTLTVGDASANEAGQGISFVVTLSRPLGDGEHVSFVYRLRESDPVSAREGGDFSPGMGTANFRRGGTSLRLRFHLRCDSVAEGDETFELVLSAVQGAALAGDGVGVGTIRDRGTRACRFDPNAATVGVPPAGLSGEPGGTSGPDPAMERDRWNPRNGAAGFAPEAATDFAGACVPLRLRSEAAARAREAWRGPAHVERWLRVGRTFAGGANDATVVTPAEARFHAAAGRPGWLPVADALGCLERRAMDQALSR